jgi:hypothetical protein
MDLLANITDMVMNRLYDTSEKEKPINIYCFTKASEWELLCLCNIIELDYHTYLAILTFEEYLIISSDGYITTKYRKNEKI